ncbi:hypothetical protein AVEN_151835-1 [Araneus ventricosus]|uniref:Uncharacterized protein n=1 Tax=Araneus ventricosus TaxID=182803 RepID=A0A4Y2H7D4_ARAVE|nr:hypothetical protein AVEN_151835-1 [Araneus ventricosus]
MVSKDQPYSQRILEISLSHRFLPQNDRKCVGNGYQENRHFCLEEALVLSNVTVRNLRQYPMEPIVNEVVSLAKNTRLEGDNNNIDEIVEEHNQELSTKELMKLHCVLQLEVMEESLSE